jgi:hypothetical protein
MKQSIRALFRTHVVDNWLATPRDARILHIFDSAWNLINERGEILSIVTPQIGNGPFNIVVRDNVLFSEHLNLQAPISNSAKQLHIGDFTIHTTAAKLWNPCPDWQLLHANRDGIFQQLTKSRITSDLNSPGLNMPFAKTAQDYRTSASTQSLIANLSSALAVADVSSARKISSQLAGSGIGLTPAGDDLLMGATYAVWIIHPFSIASVLAKEIAEATAPLTTSLSAAWLRSAGRGEVGILWHEFFDALISKDDNRTEESKNRILAVGETSGADALAGLNSVFASWIEQTGSSHG